jgi:Pyruvate/2-oxoacid:ferredoxin oxidoreductase gamma subunit
VLNTVHSGILGWAGALVPTQVDGLSNGQYRAVEEKGVNNTEISIDENKKITIKQYRRTNIQTVDKQFNYTDVGNIEADLIAIIEHKKKSPWSVDITIDKAEIRYSNKLSEVVKKATEAALNDPAVTKRTEVLEENIQAVNKSLNEMESNINELMEDLDKLNPSDNDKILLKLCYGCLNYMLLKKLNWLQIIIISCFKS